MVILRYYHADDLWLIREHYLPLLVDVRMHEKPLEPRRSPKLTHFCSPEVTQTEITI
jgi:hypothetical protein